MGRFLNSSIGRKVSMALSALFLMFFLLQHFVINLTSLLSDKGAVFNQLSYFMGTNPVVQYGLQPVLLIGVIYHFVMGFILEIKNKKARGKVSYAKNNGAANSSWMSRNMVYTGAAILLFMVFHFNDFWVPEIIDKFIEGNAQEGKDYFAHVQHMFVNPYRVVVYVLAFVFLSLHLQHGFSSAFQSVGVDSQSPKASNKYAPALKKFGNIYAVAIPAGYVVIAVFHYIQSFNH